MKGFAKHLPACAIAAAVMLASYGIWMLSVDLRLKHEISALREAGIPSCKEEMEAFAAKLLEGRIDATPLFLEAAKLFPDSAPDAPYVTVPLIEDDSIQLKSWVKFEEPTDIPPFRQYPKFPTKASLRKAADYLKEQEKGLRALKTALDVGATSRSEFDAVHYFRAGYIPLHGMQKKLRLETLIEIDKGDEEAAFSSLAYSVKLSGACPCMPARGKDLFKRIDVERALTQLRGSEASLKRLQEALEELDFGVKAAKAELAEWPVIRLEMKAREDWVSTSTGLHDHSAYGEAPGELCELFMIPGQIIPLQCLRSNSFRSSAWKLSANLIYDFYRLSGMKMYDMASYIGFMRESISLLGKPESAAYEEIINRHYNKAHRDSLFAICRSEEGWVFHATRNLFEAEALRRCETSAVAIRRFELKNGRLPESLDELVPEFLKKLPADPFDGKPLKYRKGLINAPSGETLNGFELWSLPYDLKNEKAEATVSGRISVFIANAPSK